MPPIHVTLHAAERWCERIDPRASLADAIEAIQAHTPALRRAAAFGCGCVRLGTGAKVVLAEGRVVTVLRRGDMARGARA